MPVPESFTTTHVLAIALGLGLAAAAGFRVFVPLLTAGLAANAGYLDLSGGFDWLSSTPALVALGTATLLEVGAYYVPWLDNTLDALASPAAVAAGIVASAAVITDVPPMVRWLVAIVGGGGVAGIIQSATVVARLKSSTLTGGFGNPVIATLELLGAAIAALLALFLPLIALVALIVLCVAILVAWRRLLAGRRRLFVPPPASHT